MKSTKFNDYLPSLRIDDVVNNPDKYKSIIVDSNAGKKEQPKEILLKNTKTPSFTKLVVIPNKNRNKFVSGANNGTIQIWEQEENTLSKINTFKNDKSPVKNLAAAASGAVVAVHEDGKIIAYIPTENEKNTENEKKKEKYISEIIASNCNVIDLVIYFSKSNEQFIVVAIDTEYKLLTWKRKATSSNNKSKQYYTWQSDNKLFNDEQTAEKLEFIEDGDEERVFLVSNERNGKKNNEKNGEKNKESKKANSKVISCFNSNSKNNTKTKIKFTFTSDNPIIKIMPYNNAILIFVAKQDNLNGYCLTKWQWEPNKQNTLSKIVSTPYDKPIKFLEVIDQNTLVTADSNNTLQVWKIDRDEQTQLWKSDKCVQVTQHPYPIVGMIGLANEQIIFADNNKHNFYLLLPDVIFDVSQKKNMEQLFKMLCSNQHTTCLGLKDWPLKAITNKYFKKLLVKNKTITTYLLRDLKIEDLQKANEIFKELLLSAQENSVITCFELPNSINKTIVAQFDFLCAVNKKKRVYNFQNYKLTTPESIKFVLELLCKRSKENLELEIAELDLSGLSLNKEHVELLSKLLQRNHAFTALKLEKIALDLNILNVQKNTISTIAREPQKIVASKLLQKLLKTLILQPQLTEIKLDFSDNKLIENELEQTINNKINFLIAVNKIFVKKFVNNNVIIIANEQQPKLSIKNFSLTKNSDITFALKLLRNRSKNNILTLTTLDLSDIHLVDRHCKYLASIAVTSVLLNNITFNKKKELQLLQTITKNNQIMELNITGTNLSCAAAKQLAVLMKQRSGKLIGEDTKLRRPSQDEQEKIIPEVCRCSMTGKIMLDPVNPPPLEPPDGDGTSKCYESEALLLSLLGQFPYPKTQETYIVNLRKKLEISSQEKISPTELKKQLYGKKLYPNTNIKNLIDDFLKQHESLYESDELYTPYNDIKIIEQAIENDKKNNTTTEVAALIKVDKRRLTKALTNGKSLLFNVCQHGSHQLVQLVIEKLLLDNKFWKIDDIAHNNGKELFFLATLNTDTQEGAECAKIIAKQLLWGEKEYKEALLDAQKIGNINFATICLGWLLNNAQCDPNAILLFAKEYLTNEDFWVKFLKEMLNKKNEKNSINPVVLLTTVRNKNDLQHAAITISKQKNTAAFLLIVEFCKSLSQSDLEKVLLTPNYKYNMLYVAAQLQTSGGVLDLLQQLPAALLNSVIIEETQQLNQQLNNNQQLNDKPNNTLNNEPNSLNLLELIIKYQDEATLKELLNKITPAALRIACANSTTKYKEFYKILYDKKVLLINNKSSEDVQSLYQENLKVLHDKFYFKENCQQLIEKIKDALTVLEKGKFDIEWQRKCEEIEQLFAPLKPYFTSTKNSPDEKLTNELQESFCQLAAIAKLYRPWKNENDPSWTSEEMIILEKSLKKLFSSTKKIVLAYPPQPPSSLQYPAFIYTVPQLLQKFSPSITTTTNQSPNNIQQDNFCVVEEISFVNLSLESTSLKNFILSFPQEKKLSLIFNNSFSTTIDISSCNNIKHLDLSNNTIDDNLKIPLNLESLTLNKITLKNIDLSQLLQLIRKYSPSLQEFIFCHNTITLNCFGAGNPFLELLQDNQCLQKITMKNTLTSPQIEKLIAALAENLSITQCDVNFDPNNDEHKKAAIILVRNTKDKNKWQEKEKMIRETQNGLLLILSTKKFEFSTNSQNIINENPQAIAQQITNDYAIVKNAIEDLHKVYYPQAIVRQFMQENVKIVATLLDFWLSINWSEPSCKDFTLQKQVENTYKKILILHDELIELSKQNTFVNNQQSNVLSIVKLEKIDIYKKHFIELLKINDFDLNAVLNQSNTSEFFSVIQDEDVHKLYFINVCKFLTITNDNLQVKKCITHIQTSLEKITEGSQLINGVLSKLVDVVNIILSHKSLNNMEKYTYAIQFIKLSCRQFPDTFDSNIRKSIGEICDVCLEKKIQEIISVNLSQKELLYQQLYQDFVENNLYLRAPQTKHHLFMEKISEIYINTTIEKIKNSQNTALIDNLFNEACINLCTKFPSFSKEKLKIFTLSICDIYRDNLITKIAAESDINKVSELCCKFDAIKKQLISCGYNTEEYNNYMRAIYAIYVPLIIKKISNVITCNDAVNWCGKLFKDVIEKKLPECCTVQDQEISNQFAITLLDIVHKYTEDKNFTFAKVTKSLKVLPDFQKQCEQLFNMMANFLPETYKQERCHDEIMPKIFKLVTDYLRKSLPAIRQNIPGLLEFGCKNNLSNIELEINKFIVKSQKITEKNTKILSANDSLTHSDEPQIATIVKQLIDLYSNKLNDFSTKYPTNTVILLQLTTIKNFLTQVDTFVNSSPLGNQITKSISMSSGSSTSSPLSPSSIKSENLSKYKGKQDDNSGNNKQSEEKSYVSIEKKIGNKEEQLSILTIESKENVEEQNKGKNNNEPSIDDLLKKQEEKEKQEEEEKKKLTEQEEKIKEEEILSTTVIDLETTFNKTLDERKLNGNETSSNNNNDRSNDNNEEQEKNNEYEKKSEENINKDAENINQNSTNATNVPNFTNLNSSNNSKKQNESQQYSQQNNKLNNNLFFSPQNNLNKSISAIKEQPLPQQPPLSNQPIQEPPKQETQEEIQQTQKIEILGSDTSNFFQPVNTNNLNNLIDGEQTENNNEHIDEKLTENNTQEDFDKLLMMMNVDNLNN